MTKKRQMTAARQQGAVLITGLIILLLMTIIGVVAMKHATLEERMSGNFKEQHRAFQATEAGLRLGERYAATQAPASAYSSGETALYDAEDAVNTNEAVPQYAFTLEDPVLREFTDNGGDSAGSAKGASKKFYVRRYVVDSSGGTAGASGANASLRSLFVTSQDL